MRSHRPERVANVIRGVVSEAISGKLSDPRISVMSSVTRVEVSRDLESAKVYVSVMGSEAEQRRTAAGLRSATGYVQRLVGERLEIRRCPKLSFHLDESIKKGNETLRLIEEAALDFSTPDKPADPSERDEASEQSSGDPA